MQPQQRVAQADIVMHIHLTTANHGVKHLAPKECAGLDAGCVDSKRAPPHLFSFCIIAAAGYYLGTADPCVTL